MAKDPKRQERGKKAWDKQLANIKAKHLEEIKSKVTPSEPVATPSEPVTTPSVTTPTSLSEHIGYILPVVLALIGGAFYLYNNKKQQPETMSEPSKKRKKYM